MSFHRTIIRLSALLAVVALAKGCGGGESPSAPPMPEPARPRTVTVSPATTELTVLGATVQLSAEVRDQNATVMAGATVTWTTSANSVATVDASGLVRAVGNGTATITASAGSASGSAAVTVAVGVASAPDLVVGSPSVSNSSPDAGASFTLSATVRNQGDGSSAATTLRYYRSINNRITTGDTEVDTDAVRALSASGTSAESIGLTAPSSPGTYYYGVCVDAVTGESDTSNNCSSAVTVTVGVPPPEPARPTTVTVSPATTELTALGTTVQLSAEVRDQNARVMAGATVTWTSSASSVGTVDAAGLVRAVGNGTATITASAGSASGSAAVTVAVGVPPAPDLVVGSPSVSNSSPVTGASFTLSATVRNQGSGPSAAMTLRYYRSTDATITTGDTEVGTDAVGTLAASGTSDESIDLTAPSSPGTYYYGACVDAVTGESDTSNNCSSAVTIAVGVPPAPDLVVGSPSVSNSSPVTGASFTLSATVRNQGSGPSPSTTLRYYSRTRISGFIISQVVGTDAVGTLAASGTSDESIDLTAPSSAGTYYYDTCVDDVTGESDTSNNCSDAVTVTVGGRPDLVVESPSVSNSSPYVGEEFTLYTTVRNQGGRPSAATTLRYYSSTDATITTGDTEVGTDAVGTLWASFTSDKWIDLTAPASVGTYYYGACVDDVTGESDTSNNCSDAVTVTVGVASAPDLVVESPSVSDSSPIADASFTLSATVRNRGTASSAATTLRYYVSTRPNTIGVTGVGTDAVDALAASATSEESIDLTAYSFAVTYYYSACVDAVTGESDTSNNCSSTVAVTFSTAPDLVVSSPSVSDHFPIAGASFTLSATVRNRGTGPSAATTLRYYRSTDETITGTDTQVGTDAVGVLAASSGTSDESIGLTAPSPGTYYYGACVDDVTGESDTSNNCSSWVAIIVPAPDLVVSSVSVSDSSPIAGASFTLSATVWNRGDDSSAATTLRYYRSTDATITTGDTQVGTDAVGALSRRLNRAESIDLTAPSSPGTYYYGACVDAVTDESDTSNNCSSAVTVTIFGPAPDLVVESPSLLDIAVVAGASFTLGATVRNQGSRPSAATTLRYYDKATSFTKTEVGTDAVGALAASATSAESIDLTAPSSPGTYYYGACVDAVTGESDTSNNCGRILSVTVLNTIGASDLVVGSPSVSDSSPDAGASFTLSVSMQNRGDGPSPSTTMRFYRSTDATITTGDTEVGTDAVPTLAASVATFGSTTVTAPASVGTYYYGACVDAVTGESDTSNNCSDAVTVTVGGRPDLVVESPSVDDDSPETGGSFTLSATVSNDGDGGSAATTLRYYRSTDATISGTDTEVGTDAVGSLAASGTSDESIDLTAPASAGRYYYGACVDDVTGESDTSNNCSSSVQVNVTEPPPPSTPDLVVGSPSVDDDSPETGGSFTLSATVSNDGDGGSAATTLRYYRSADATITTGDTQVGTDAVGTLAASGTSAESIDLTAPSSAGTYYYEACVDSVDGESTTNNNCSDGLEVEVSDGGGGREGECVLGATYAGGESCDVYGTGSSSKLTFTVLSDGRARLGFITSGSGISTTGTINGVKYHFVASHQGGGIWEIDEYIP